MPKDLLLQKGVSSMSDNWDSKHYSSYSYYLVNKNAVYGKWAKKKSYCGYCGYPMKHANPYAKKGQGSLFCKLYHIDCERNIRYLIARYGAKAYKLLIGELE